MMPKVLRVSPAYATLRIPKHPEPVTLAQLAELVAPYLPLRPPTQAYTVVCRNSQGHEAWSLTQEAESPAWAVARTCLPRYLRQAYVDANCPCVDGMFAHPTSLGFTVEVTACATR